MTPIIITLRYIITLCALSLMVFTRWRMGQEVFLPWQMKFKDKPLRVLIRLLLIALLFIWIRVYFLIAVTHAEDPMPFDTTKNLGELFIEHQFYSGISIPIVFYYLSFAGSIAALIHLIAFEVYYRIRKPVSNGSLGKCLMTGWMEKRKILGCSIDNYLIWGLIEPSVIIGIGFLLKSITGSDILFIFFLLPGIAMALQGQLARLKHRDIEQEIIDAKLQAETVRTITSSFDLKDKAEKNSNQGDTTGEATIA